MGSETVQRQASRSGGGAITRGSEHGQGPSGSRHPHHYRGAAQAFTPLRGNDPFASARQEAEDHLKGHNSRRYQASPYVNLGEVRHTGGHVGEIAVNELEEELSEEEGGDHHMQE